jgi:hypothetical protein
MSVIDDLPNIDAALLHPIDQHLLPSNYPFAANPVAIRLAP